MKSARGLGEKLRIHTPALKAVGIKIYFDPVRHNDGYHVMIKTVGDTCSQPSQRSRSQQPSNSSGSIKSEHREHSEHVTERVSRIVENSIDDFDNEVRI